MASETKWLIELKGRETRENYRIERTGKGSVKVFERNGPMQIKVYGSAYIDYDTAAVITIPNPSAPNQRVSGNIIRARITDFHATYTPLKFYGDLKIKCNKELVARLTGILIKGILPTANTLMLNWPHIVEPSVIVEMEINGRSMEARFMSVHFFDYVSSYELQLKNPWTQEWKHKFDQAVMEKADVKYQFRITSIS